MEEHYERRLEQMMAAWHKRQEIVETKKIKTVASVKRPSDEPLVSETQAASLARWYAR